MKDDLMDDWMDRELVMGKAFGLWGGNLDEIEEVAEAGTGHWALVSFREMYPDPNGFIHVDSDDYGPVRCSSRLMTYGVCSLGITAWSEDLGVLFAKDMH
jgi:hypothetical protein